MGLEYFDVEQGSEAWIKCRLGCVSASEMSTVMAKGEGKTRRAYMLRLAVERMTGEPCKTFNGNPATERGNELEPIAAELYAERTGEKLETVGFYKNNGIGCSPDRKTSTGGLEIKNPLPYTHLDILDSRKIPREYMLQMQTSLLVTGWDHWTFFSNCPGLPPFIEEVFPDRSIMDSIQEAGNAFNAELATLVDKLNEMY